MSTSIELKGNYNPNEDYEVLNVVNFGGKTFVVVRSNRKIAPTDTQYWAMVEKGEPGPAGHSPKIEVKDNFLWIDGKKSAFLQGPAGSMAETNVLPANADLNDYKNNGFFIAANIKTKNSPFHDTGVGTDLFVMTVISWLGLYVKQEITDLNNNITYVRTNKSYEWSKWQKLSGSEVS